MAEKPRIIETLADVVPDERNPNSGTVRGHQIVRESLQRLGAGRSILVDRHGRIIAGNKTAEEAYAAGMEDVLLVRSDGSKLVVVQREDLDLDEDDGRARELSIADNRASEAGLEWDLDTLSGLTDRESLAWLWNEDELDLIFDDDPPGLDDLAVLVGEPNDDDFWPEIRLRVPPETHKQYEALIALFAADSDVESFGLLLAAVDTSHA